MNNSVLIIYLGQEPNFHSFSLEAYNADTGSLLKTSLSNSEVDTQHRLDRWFDEFALMGRVVYFYDISRSTSDPCERVHCTLQKSDPFNTNNNFVATTPFCCMNCVHINDDHDKCVHPDRVDSYDVDGFAFCNKFDSPSLD